MEHAITVVPAVDGLTDVDVLTTTIRDAILAGLAHENVAIPCDIYVMLTDDPGIRALNAEHRGLDRATDVLSFPMLELTPGAPIEVSPLELDPDTGRLMLGDMVISVERTTAQAVEYGHSLAREIAFLAVHSLLHLLGYDHEKSEADETLHFTRQEEILREAGFLREGTS